MIRMPGGLLAEIRSRLSASESAREPGESLARLFWQLANTPKLNFSEKNLAIKMRK